MNSRGDPSGLPFTKKKFVSSALLMKCIMTNIIANTGISFFKYLNEGRNPPESIRDGYRTRRRCIENEWKHIRLKSGRLPVQSGNSMASEAVGSVTA